MSDKQVLAPGLKAVRYKDFPTFELRKEAGSYIILMDDDKEGYFHYYCACGCGSYGCIAIGREKPADSPSWQWDGNFDAPKLHPSLWHKWGPNKDHWHGWLKAGVWSDA